MRVLVYADGQKELAALAGRLDADGHSTTGTTVDELAIDLASAAEFDALVVDRRATAAQQLRLTAEISRRSPDMLVVRSNGPEAVLTQLRQAAAERSSERGASGEIAPPDGGE